MQVILTDKVGRSRGSAFPPSHVGWYQYLNEQRYYRVAYIIYFLGRSLLRLNNSAHRPKAGTRRKSSIDSRLPRRMILVNFAYVKLLLRARSHLFHFSGGGFSRNLLLSSSLTVELLEKTLAAPRLFYHGEIGVSCGDPTYGHLHMVVMEYRRHDHGDLTSSRRHSSRRFKRYWTD